MGHSVLKVKSYQFYFQIIRLVKNLQKRIHFESSDNEKRNDHWSFDQRN